MRYPVVNFRNEWNITFGLGFGEKTSYGYHEGVDINKNGTSDVELGENIEAITEGKLVYYHGAKHPNAGFGYHNVYEAKGPWGTRWIHQAHNLPNQIMEVRDVREGQKVASVGKSGTKNAHVHFAIFKVDPVILRDGIDTIAKTKIELNEWWESPIAFIDKWTGEYYKGYNLLDKESMKAAVDVLVRVQNKEFLPKQELEKYIFALSRIKEIFNDIFF